MIFIKDGNGSSLTLKNATPTGLTIKSTKSRLKLFSINYMPDPTVPACSDCGDQIPDPAEHWPSASTGTVCQVCWEAQCSWQWWAMLQLVPERNAHA